MEITASGGLKNCGKWEREAYRNYLQKKCTLESSVDKWVINTKNG